MLENNIQSGVLNSFINANILPKTVNGVKANRKRHNRLYHEHLWICANYWLFTQYHFMFIKSTLFMRKIS